MPSSIVILGVFVADTAFRADRQPRLGETLIGREFRLGPGGKGSNQAVAAARAGGPELEVHFITRLGADAFGDMARALWRETGVSPALPRRSPETGGAATGAAYIFIEAASGDNAIIICPGVAAEISPGDIAGNADLFEGAAVFMTQLEQPVEAALAGLETARARDVVTILNPAPAPAAPLPAGMLALCDYVTPNETEAEGLTGIPVTSIDDARRAAAALIRAGAGAAIVTLGERGALYHDGSTGLHLPAMDAGPVVETTGAGDAFNGAFAAALAQGREPVQAVRFANAAAAISVTRPGTAPAMAGRAEIEALIGS